MTFDATFAQEVQEVTGYPLLDLLDQYATFVETDFVEIANYFSGQLDSLNSQTWANLLQLRNRVDTAKSVVVQNRTRFVGFGFWEILDILETMQTRLMTISRLDKWTRASGINAGFTRNAAFPYTQGQGQTLEQISSRVTGSNNSQEAWLDIAVQNNISETDYTLDGGKQLQVRMQTDQRLFLNSVVDVMQGEKLFGKDVAKRFQFVDDDLLTVQGEEAFTQAVSILGSIRRGDVPENEFFGLDPKLIVGNNFSSVFYASILRQLREVFAADDSVVNVEFREIRREGEVVYIDYVVQSFAGTISDQTLALQ